MSALEHLDARYRLSSTAFARIGGTTIDPTNAAAVARAKSDADDTSSNGTFASSGRLLLETIMMATSDSQPGVGVGAIAVSIPCRRNNFRVATQGQPFVKDQIPSSNAEEEIASVLGGMSVVVTPLARLKPWLHYNNSSNNSTSHTRAATTTAYTSDATWK
jgi:hypothetical protein